MASTAAVTSRLGGSALVWPAGQTTPSSSRLSGNITGDTGRTALNDGTYLFVYKQGASPVGKIADGKGAFGSIGDNRFAGTYDYVRVFRIRYPGAVTGRKGGFDGFNGMITAGGDMPSGGSASYTGEVAIDMFQHGLGAASPILHLDRGTSTISADFASGTAAVDLGAFRGRTNGTNVPITVAAAQFDQVTGSGLTISGSHFTGGNWVTLKGGNPVSVVGANQTANSHGTFFAYNPRVSAPDEVAGVFVIDGDTNIITGRYIANVN